MDLIIQIILILVASKLLTNKINLNNNKIMTMVVVIVLVTMVNKNSDSKDANNMVMFVGMIVGFFIFKDNILESMSVVGLCKSNSSLSYQLRDVNVCKNILPTYLGGKSDIVFDAKNTEDLAKKVIEHDNTEDGIACANWIRNNIQCPDNESNNDNDAPVSPLAKQYECADSDDQFNCIQKAICQKDKSKSWCDSINQCISKEELKNNKFYKNSKCSTEIEEEHEKNKKRGDNVIPIEDETNIVPQEEQEEYAEYPEQEAESYLLFDEEEEHKMLGGDESTWTPKFLQEDEETKILGADESTWTPKFLQEEETKMLGGDESTWTPKYLQEDEETKMLGADESTWTPKYLQEEDSKMLGGDESTWTPKYLQEEVAEQQETKMLGGDESTWTPKYLQEEETKMLGGDESTWTPKHLQEDSKMLGTDESTWTPKHLQEGNVCNVYAYGPDGSEWKRIKPAKSKCYLEEKQNYKVRKNGKKIYTSCNSMNNLLKTECGDNKQCIINKIKGWDSSVCLNEL